MAFSLALPDIDRDMREMISQARSLAVGLRSYRSDPTLPGWLREPVYLLTEAQRTERPLEERLRILGLMATSIDQFFITQLPVLQQAAEMGNAVAAQSLADLPGYLQPLLQEATRYLRDAILPALAREELQLSSVARLREEEQAWLRRYFYRRVYPLLIPLAVDPGRPFPFISSFSLNLLVQLGDTWTTTSQELPGYARVKVPRLIPRLIVVGTAANSSPRTYVWSEDLVRFFRRDLFPGVEVVDAHLFRVLRADGRQPPARRSTPANDPTRYRRRMPVTRLDVEATMPRPMLEWLVGHLSAPAYTVYRMDSPLSQTQLVDLANLVAGHHLPLQESVEHVNRSW